MRFFDTEFYRLADEPAAVMDAFRAERARRLIRLMDVNHALIYINRSYPRISLTHPPALPYTGRVSVDTGGRS